MIDQLIVTPASASQAYQRVAAGQPSLGGGQSFAEALQDVLQSAVQAGTAADGAAANGLSGQGGPTGLGGPTGEGGLTQIVTAVEQAQLTLQTTVAIRDRMVQAYQTIMAMPI